MTSKIINLKPKSFKGFTLEQVIAWLEREYQMELEVKDSYVEDKKEGSPWHADSCKPEGTGPNMSFLHWNWDEEPLKVIDNHASWNVFAVVFMQYSENCVGGNVYFKDTDLVLTPEMYEEKGPWAWSCGYENIHRVDPHTGIRRVRLVFLGDKNEKSHEHTLEGRKQFY